MIRNDDRPTRRTAGGLALAVGVLCTVALVAAGPARAGTHGACIRVNVSEEILLPDGTLHPAGSLTLCDSVTISPVSSLHATYVNGLAVAMLRSRRTNSEGADRITPVVFFERDGEGHMRLEGYVLPARGRSVTYLLGDEETLAAPPAVATGGSPHETTPAPGAGPVIVAAAFAH